MGRRAAARGRGTVPRYAVANKFVRISMLEAAGRGYERTAPVYTAVWILDTKFSTLMIIVY